MGRELSASPAYVKVRGAPKNPTDPASHDCVSNETFATSSN
jgi:hypothetical protein